MSVLRSPLRGNLRSSVYGPLVGKWGGEIAPPAPSPPAQFGSSDWSVTDAATSGDITITITALPDSDSPITDIEYQLDGGSWVSLAGTTTGDYGVSGLTDNQEYDVAIRAVSAEGNGAASATKTVTPTAPASTWQTVFEQALTTDENGWQPYTTRIVIPAASLADVTGGSKIRVTMAANISNPGNVQEAYLGHAAATGDAWDFDGNQVQMKLAGNGTFTVPTNTDTLLDEAIFTYNGTKNLVFAVAWAATDGNTRKGSLSGGSVSFKSGNDAATTDADNYTSVYTNTLLAVEKIEVFAP